MAPPEQRKNGVTSLLQTLASSGDRAVQLGTLIVVIFAGIGNFMETREASEDNRQLFQKQTHEIWAALDRNKENFRALFENATKNRQLLMSQVDDQTKLLKNQEQLLRNQQVLLEALERGQIQFLQRQQRLFKQEP